MDGIETMAKLEVLGVTVAFGDEHIARVQEAYPDLTIRAEQDLEKASELMTDADAFVGRARHINAMSKATNLRWVQTLTAGADAIPVEEVTRRGIVLTNGSGIHAPNLAEHILGFMLAFARNFPTLFRRQLNHEWNQELQQFELEGQTLCVVGLGEIGQSLGKKASAIGMRVTAVRRRERPAPSFVDRTATFDTMDPLLAEADHVALTLPLTSATHGIFDADRLDQIKNGAYIYNVGRGELVDQDAVMERLRSGRLAGAGLDVTSPEPLPPKHPLWDMENVLITCHTGGRSPERMHRFVDLLIDNIRRYRNDEPLRNIVDLEAGY